VYLEPMLSTYACILFHTPIIDQVKLFMIDKKRYILVDSSDSMVKLRCPRCGHVWEYRGNLVLATCPSCYKKIDVRKYREVESNE
jgi:Zn-finger nucleic acid-binding protein